MTDAAEYRCFAFLFLILISNIFHTKTHRWLLASLRLGQAGTGMTCWGHGLTTLQHGGYI